MSYLLYCSKTYIAKWNRSIKEWKNSTWWLIWIVIVNDGFQSFQSWTYILSPIQWSNDKCLFWPLKTHKRYCKGQISIITQPRGGWYEKPLHPSIFPMQPFQTTISFSSTLMFCNYYQHKNGYNTSKYDLNFKLLG